MIPTLLGSGILAFFVFFLKVKSFGYRNFEGLKKKVFETSLQGSIRIFLV